MLRLRSSDYFEVTLSAEGTLCLTRTETPYPDLEVALAEFSELTTYLDAPRWTGGLVVDARRVQGRNDEAFEARLKPVWDTLVRRSRRVAFVVRTVAGGMQVRRLSGDRGVPLEVFDALEPALTYASPRPEEAVFRARR